MYTLKVSANTPSYLRKFISNDKFNSLSARDQQFYSRVKEIPKEPSTEPTTVVGKDLLGNDELQTVDRNICDERNL